MTFLPSRRDRGKTFHCLAKDGEGEILFIGLRPQEEKTVKPIIRPFSAVFASNEWRKGHKIMGLCLPENCNPEFKSRLRFQRFCRKIKQCALVDILR